MAKLFSTKIKKTEVAKMGGKQLHHTISTPKTKTNKTFNRKNLAK